MIEENFISLVPNTNRWEAKIVCQPLIISDSLSEFRTKCLSSWISKENGKGKRESTFPTNSFSLTLSFRPDQDLETLSLQADQEERANNLWTLNLRKPKKK